MLFNKRLQTYPRTHVAQISVCLASYNGAKFLNQQLESILAQLSQNDEIIIVDDSSTDRTIEIINKFDDPRIRLLINPQNQGLLTTFNRALANAHGNIIMLSDQDDVWLPQKVGRVLEVFEKTPTITLVASRVQVIDEIGNVAKALHPRFYQKNNNYWLKNVISNILVNRYLGCTLAFRAEMLRYILPIPATVPMHDMWIGIINDIWGQTYYNEQPLVQYRRHSTNVTSDRRSSVRQIVLWRYHLIKNLLFLITHKG